MPVLDVGDNVLVTKTARLFGQLIMSTFGYVVTEKTGAVDQDTAFSQLNIAMCAAGEVHDAYNRCCPDQMLVEDIWYQVIRPTRYRKYYKADLTTGVFSGFSANTANVASTITRVGELGRRSNISSLHVPAPTGEDWLESGNITVAGLAKLEALADACRATYTIALGSTKFSPSILNGPLAANVTPITYAFHQTTVRVMRRRTVGVGK